MYNCTKRAHNAPTEFPVLFHLKGQKGRYRLQPIFRGRNHLQLAVVITLTASAGFGDFVVKKRQFYD